MSSFTVALSLFGRNRGFSGRFLISCGLAGRSWEVTRSHRGPTALRRVQLNSGIHFKTKVAYESLRKKKPRRCEVQLTLMRWLTSTSIFSVLLLFCIVYCPWVQPGPSVLRHVTTCWDAGHCRTGAFASFFSSSDYYMSYWCHLADWKRKKTGVLLHSISTGKQHNGKFPTFTFLLNFTHSNRRLGNLYGIPGSFFLFFFFPFQKHDASNLHIVVKKHFLPHIGLDRRCCKILAGHSEPQITVTVKISSNCFWYLTLETLSRGGLPTVMDRT